MWRCAVGVVLVLGLLGGCAEATSLHQQEVRLRTNRGEYSVGETGVLALDNLGPHPVGPGNIGATLLCKAGLERHVEGAWQPLGTLPGACILILLPPLQAGRTVETEFEITSELWPSTGDYRFNVTVIDASTGEPLVVRSEPFSVVVG